MRNPESPGRRPKERRCSIDWVAATCCRPIRFRRTACPGDTAFNMNSLLAFKVTAWVLLSQQISNLLNLASTYLEDLSVARGAHETAGFVEPDSTMIFFEHPK